LINLLATFPANASENHAFADNAELFVYVTRNCQIIIGPAIKIEYLTAMSAMDMVVVTDIRIESLGSAESFDDLYNADLGEGQKGAVHGVEGNVAIFFFDDLINGVSRRMGVRIKEFAINRDPLGGNFKSMRLTDLFELPDFIGMATYLHSYLK